MTLLGTGIDTPDALYLVRARILFRSLIALEHGPCRHWLIDPLSIPENWANRDYICRPLHD